MPSVLWFPHRPLSGRGSAGVPMNPSEHHDAQSTTALVWSWVRVFLGALGIITIFVNLCLVGAAAVDLFYKKGDWTANTFMAVFFSVNGAAGLILAIWG